MPHPLRGLMFLAAAAVSMTAGPVLAGETSIADDYCANIIDKAADARAAWQAANLQKLEKDVSEKLSQLDAKQRELQDWMAKRDLMLKAAGQELADIYAKMDPDAASGQLAKIDTGTATSILRQLTPRGASAILNVMDAERAAVLVKAIAAATKDAPPGGGT
jgi:flagellar motility protein MotE (MotC chaperone)